MVAPLLVLAGPVAPALAISSVPGGPVILDGNDPGDHLAAVTSYVRNVYTNLDANIAAGYVHNNKVAVIGPCTPILNSISIPGQTFDSFATVSEIQGFFSNIGTNNYKIVHICSNDETGAVDLTAAEEAEIALWGSAIATHVNRGGGLFSTGHGYAWLTDLFPTLVVTAGGTGSSYVTTDGALFFPTLPVNTLVNAVNHFTFSSVPNPPLKTLLTENSGGGGRLVAIGGVTVRFPQIFLDGPASSDVGTPETYTLTAATADGTVLSNNSFTYTITGVTGSIGSGTAVTDANGQYTFNLSGNARGTTKIKVQLTLGGGTAAGTSTTTTWKSLASAPTLTAADDVAGVPTSTQLTWNAPASSGLTAITDYVIQYTADGTTWTTVADGTSTSTSYTVTGLDPNGIYDFRVAAVNSDGAGAWSNIMTNPIPVAQTITFPAPSSTVVSDGPVAMTASASSGLAVSYTSNSSSVCTVSGASVTLVAAGTCSITASQAGNRSYAAATVVTRTFAVTAVPALPAPSAATTTGLVTATQSTVITVPTGGSVVLLNAAGTPVTLLTVDGQGTYALDATTGTITFVPVAGFTGTATPVNFRVTDRFNQTATGTYTAIVTPVVTPGASPVAAVPAAPVTGSLRAPVLTVANGPKATVPVSCTLKSVRVYRCQVTLWATVSGVQLIVGKGTTTVRKDVVTSKVVVNVTLNALGRALAAQPGGTTMRAAAAITPRGTTRRVHVKTLTRVVAQRFTLPRPVFFDSGQSRIKPSERRYLDSLRRQLAGVKTIDCAGYTDAMDTSGSNRKLGMARAKKVCAYLVRGTRIKVRSVTLGEDKPQSTNATLRGRALNRRTEIRLNY
jgi:CshA-type fibril repeat protein